MSYGIVNDIWYSNSMHTWFRTQLPKREKKRGKNMQQENVLYIV